MSCPAEGAGLNPGVRPAGGTRVASVERRTGGAVDIPDAGGARDPYGRLMRDECAGAPTVSADLERWLDQGGDATLGALVERFGQKSFALVFVMLLGVPALPLPTGGATHVFELIAALLALELIAGRTEIWLPRRWSRIDLAGPHRQRFARALLAVIRRLERLSRPRLRVLFEHRVSNVVFGGLVLAGSLAAFLAPPFTGLDTLPALGVVLVSVGVLLEDIVIVLLGMAIGAIGVVLEIVVGSAAVRGLSDLL